MSWNSSEVLARLVNECLYVGVFLSQLPQALDQLLELQAHFSHMGSGSCGATVTCRHRGCRGRDSGVFLKSSRMGTQVVLERLQTVFENLRIGSRSNREEPLEILDEEFSLDKSQSQFLILQDLRKGMPKKRQQNLAFQSARRRMPVNVEVGGIDRGRPVFEYIHPPSVLRGGRHVIRNDIQEQAHIALS